VKLSCAEITPLLFAFEAGALDSPEASEHLLECHECVGRFLTHKRVREDAAAFDERPSGLVRERLRKRVAQRGRRRPLVWAFAAAALIAAVLAARAAFVTRDLKALTPLIDSAPLSQDLM
jgi:hypothetical protein